MWYTVVLLSYSGLKPAPKIVLIQLADFHNKEIGQCNPSAQWLADECEMGRAMLFRNMTTLEQSGLFTRQSRGDGDGGRMPNQYNCISTLHLGKASCLAPRAKGNPRADNLLAMVSRLKQREGMAFSMVLETEHRV